MTFGSLFSGIGGIDLGLERAGMDCSWQVEIDGYARQVIAQQWLGVRLHDDVRSFPPRPAEHWAVDVVCGGFPCQDISDAGKRAGIDGARSGLWGEFCRIIRTLRPRYVVLENVGALLRRGFGRVLGDLAACRYDAEWDCLPAAAFGAPHRRDRVFIVAYPTGLLGGTQWRGQPDGILPSVFPTGNCRHSSSPALSALPESAGLEEWRQRIRSEYAGWWAAEPDVGRVAHGIPNRVDRLRCLGNAVVPQIPEWLGKRILEFDAKIRSHA